MICVYRIKYFILINQLSDKENSTQTLEKIFLAKAVKFRILQISKILNTDVNKIFAIPFKAMYVSLRYIKTEKQFRSK